MRAVLLAAIVATATACNPAPPAVEDYTTRIVTLRSEKETFFQTSSDSPVPETRKKTFLPLDYFPIDPSYNVPARLEPARSEEVILMPTSTGTQDEMRRVGTLHFALQGQPLKLTAFVSATSSRLFVPFRDTTAGEATYPAGRYLEIDRNASGIYEIDFNTAFNPYCYYNPVYVCPLPPRENHLPIAIHAGERVKDGTTS